VPLELLVELNVATGGVVGVLSSTTEGVGWGVADPVVGANVVGSVERQTGLPHSLQVRFR
jgi:ethanolamine ammonia-lyase large subunit